MTRASAIRLQKAARLALGAGVIASALSAALVQAEPAADTLPSGEQVTAGSAHIAQDGAHMTITQHSDRMIAEWQEFSIGRDAQVEFVQPGADSAALNRVIGGRPSEIFGSLTANGRVLLVNQAGIHFANGSRVDVGGLVASTLDIADQDFLDDKLHFSGGSSAGSITAEGEIAIANGGRLAFVAPLIEHRGTIDAAGGEVTMAAAEEVELSLGETGLVSLKVNRGALDAAIDNGGAIDVGGGAVVLTAGGLDELTRGVVNNTGIVEANGLSEVGGRIVLKADGAVENAGRLAANSESDQGGQITIEADDITLTDAAELTATGATGGGDILVGGDWQGGANEARRVFDDPDALMEATTVTMQSGATIDASATDNGNGGTVVLWSDISNPDSITSVHGEIYAKGGVNGGDGGQIETSGYRLVTAGATGSAAAREGAAGEWLFDPYNVEIVESDSNSNGSFNNSDPDIWTPTGNNSKVLASAIESTLEGGTDVTITTTGGGSQGGDLTVSSAITQDSGDHDTTLTLEASRNLFLNAAITSTSGKLNLVLDADRAGNDVGSTIITADDIDTNGGDLTIDGVGAAFQSSSAQTVHTGGGALTINGEVALGNAVGVTLNSSNGAISIAGRINSTNTYSVDNTNRDWDAAFDEHGGDGSDGNPYLVTITGPLENSLVGAQLVANDLSTAWAGGSDKDNEGTWKWMTGPESGDIFFVGNRGDSREIEVGFKGEDGSFVSWNEIEPNDAGGEDYLEVGFGEQDLWNDNDIGVSRPSVLETEANPSPLTIDAGSGSVSIGGGIGTSKALGSLDVTSASTTVTGGGIVTTGAQTYSSGLTVNSSGSTTDVILEAADNTIEVAGPITVYGGDINVDANLTSEATSGAGITLTGQRIIQDDGIDVTTSGADISYTASGYVTPDSDERTLIAIEGDGTNHAIVDADGGNITIAGSYAAGGAGDRLTRAISFSIADLMTSGSGAISLTGDATNAPSTTESAWGMQPNDARIITEDGAITLDMTGGEASGNSRGMALDGQSMQLLSTSGNITIIDREPASLTGNYNGLYLLPSTANAILFGADGSEVISSSSDVVIEADKVSFVGTTTRIKSSGELSIEPLSASFGSAFTYQNINLESTATGLTLGKTGNTFDITLSTPQTIAGPISVYGGDITFNESLTSTASGADILLKGSGEITLAGSKNIQSNNGDITFWSDSDNNSEGAITILAGASINSQGGNITLAGGADDGSNGGTASDGIPDGYAWRSVNEEVLGGLSLGEGVLAGHGVANDPRIDILSGGGDIKLHGRYSGADNYPGVLTQENILVDAGTGTISINGHSSNGHGIEFARGATSHQNVFRSKSNDATKPAISIVGTTTSDARIAVLLEKGGSSLIQSEGTGEVYVRGTATVRQALIIKDLQILAASGDISFEGSTTSTNGIELINTDIGQRSSTTAIQGITPLATSSSNVAFKSTGFTFSDSESLISSTGSLTIEPLSGASFGTAFTYADFLTIDNNLTGLTIGKVSNTTDVTLSKAIDIAGPISVYGGDINVDANLNTTAGAAAGDILLKASENIVIDTPSITTDDGAVTLWANSNDNDSGMVYIDTATIQTSGGHLWIGGGAEDATAWNGLTVGDGYAVGNAAASNGFTLIDSTVDTDGGNLAIYGKSRAGNYSFDTGSFTSNTGIRFYEGNTLDSGTGTIHMEGVGRGTNSSSNGIEFSKNSADTIQSANTTGSAISLAGYANSAPEDVQNAWGVYTWNAVVQATGTGGGVTVRGSGSKQNGIMVPSSSSVLAKSGPITLIGTGYGSGADAVGIAGTVGRKTGTGVTTSSSNVTIQGDTFDITGSIVTAGSVVIEPFGTSFAAEVTSPNGVSSDINGLTLGKAGNTRKVTIDADTTVSGPITIYSDNLFIDAVLTATNDRISLIGAGASNSQGTLETLAGADITADELVVRNFHRAYLGTKAGSSVGTVSVNTVASDGGDWLLLENDKALTIGSIEDVDGVTASGSINVATRSGNLSVDQSVQASAASGGITLNAGKSESAGTGSGGNIIIADGVTVTTGAGGRARLYTGTVSGSTRLTDLVGSGSGNFRYNADENTDLTVSGRTNIGTSGTFAIYREQPTVTGTIESATITYGESTPTLTLGSAAGVFNGDTSAPTITGGTTSGAGLLEVKDGGYAITPAALSGLGYDVSGVTNGTLTVNAKALSVTGLTAQDKTYDGSDAATLSAAGSLDGVETGDTVSFTTASTFNNENVELTKTLDLDYTLAGADSGNYTLADETGVATAAQITAKAIAVTAGAKSKTYGSADPTLTYTTDVSLISGDSFTGALSRATGEDVGTYAINQGTLSINDGNGGNNYTLTYTSADLTINPLAITVTADAKTKVYGNADPALTYSADVSLVSGDSFTGAISRAAGENVGTYAINQNTLAIDDGNDGNNYTLTYVSDDLEITKRSVTLTAPSVSKTYDGNNLHETTQANLDALSAQLVRGDRITTAEILYDDKNAGAGKTVSINSVTLEDGNSGNNYNVGTTSDTSGEIIKAPLTITAVDDAEFVTKTDNRANYGGVIYDGFVAGETAADLAGLGTPEFTIGTVERSNDSVSSAGFYAGVLEPTGFAADNYEITEVDGDYTIVPADALLVRAGTTDVTYGASPSYSPIAEYLDDSNNIISSSTDGSGLSITVTDGSADVDDSAGGNAQFDITIQSTAADLSSSDNLSVGGYQLTSENEQVTGENFGSLMFVGALQVAPKTLNNDLGISSVEKVYDGSRAVTDLGLDIDRTLAGVIGADAVTVAGSGTFDTRHVGEEKSINISLALRGDDAKNYALASSSFSDSVGTITQLESVEWVGADGADWSDSGNWAGGAIPDQSNVGEIIIPNAATSVYNADDFGTTQSLITNNGVIRFESANDFTLANQVVGAGTLEQAGAGNLTLSGSSTGFAGSLAIDAGEVLIDDNDALGSAPNVSGTGGTLSLGNGVTLPSLVTSGELQLGSDITTLGAQTHGAELVLDAGDKVGETVTPLEITTSNADITLNGSLTAGTGAKAAKRSVTVDAGTGAVTVNAQVGQDLRDGENRILWANYDQANINPFRFTVKGGDIRLNADVTTFEEQRYEGPVRIGSTADTDSLRLLVSLDPAVSFTDTINDATANGGVHGLAVYAVSSMAANDPDFVMPAIDFAGAIGQTNPLERLIVEVGMQDQGTGARVADIDLSDRSDANTFFGEVRIAEDVWTSSPTQRYVGRNVRLGNQVEFATSERQGGWSPEFTRGTDPTTGVSLPFTNYPGGSGLVAPVFRASQRLPGEPDLETLGPNLGLMKLLAAADTSPGNELLDIVGLGQGLLRGDVAVGEVRTAEGDAPPLCDDDPDDPDCVED